MERQNHQTLFVLAAGAAVMALLWLAIGAGCGTPVAPDNDEVRRLAARVWAGSPGNNPPELNDGNWKDLFAGNSIRTDSSGEAELRLVGCDGSVWVFDNSTLSVWTCTKKAEQENEYWCNEEGTAAFNISCAARFEVVDTPSAQVNIKATAFTVTYMPERQLTLVIVFRGLVEVTPVLDMGTLELGAPVPVEPGYFLYTMPGQVSPQIGGIRPREARPLVELPFVVQELGIRLWMDDITRWGTEQQILVPSWPYLGLTLDFDGEQLADPRVQQAFVLAIDKERVMASAFPNETLRFDALIAGAPVDAFTLPYNPEEALKLLAEAGYTRSTVLLLYPEGDSQLATAAKLISANLMQLDMGVEMVPVPAADLDAMRKEYASAGQPVVLVHR